MGDSFTGQNTQPTVSKNQYHTKCQKQYQQMDITDYSDIPLLWICFYAKKAADKFGHTVSCGSSCIRLSLKLNIYVIN